MDVSIILVSYNTKELTRNCLKSIKEKTNELNYDIWVVDNNSKDGSPEMIAKEFPDVNLIKSQDNLGFGRANNLAIEKSNAKYVFLLNTDTVLLNNAVKILFDFMESERGQKAGACGGQLFNADMTLQLSYGEFYDLYKLREKAYGTNFFTLEHRLRRFLSKKILRETNYEHDTQKIGAHVDYIIGADLMLRREALEQSGGFDKRFFMYGEEAELQYRIKKNGYDILFVPDSQIMHFGGASTSKENTSLEVENMLMKGTILFFNLCYGKNAAIEARKLYIIYHLRYLFLRFFSPKAFTRLKYAIELQVEDLSN